MGHIFRSPISYSFVRFKKCELRCLSFFEYYPLSSCAEVLSTSLHICERLRNKTPIFPFYPATPSLVCVLLSPVGLNSSTRQDEALTHWWVDKEEEQAGHYGWWLHKWWCCMVAESNIREDEMGSKLPYPLHSTSKDSTKWGCFEW